jgi:hypothetical protein
MAPKKVLKIILNEIDWHKHRVVTAFLRNVIFWHHRSTSGRFNDKLGRFERWGVDSVDGWRNRSAYQAPNPGYKTNCGEKPYSKTIDKPISRRSFFRIKDRLLDMGLIEAKSHFRRDDVDGEEVTALWIKPTQELCRIVFEPGYWEKVRPKYANVKTKKKPRGVHAHKSL